MGPREILAPAIEKTRVENVYKAYFKTADKLTPLTPNKENGMNNGDFSGVRP